MREPWETFWDFDFKFGFGTNRDAGVGPEGDSGMVNDWDPLDRSLRMSGSLVIYFLPNKISAGDFPVEMCGVALVTLRCLFISM